MGTKPMLGKEFAVFYDTSIIAYSTDFDFELNKEVIDITSLASNGWKENDVGFKDWSLNFNGLVTRTMDPSTSIDYDDLITSIKTDDSSLRVALKPYDVSGNLFSHGMAFLTSIKASGAISDKVTFSGTFIGTSALDTSTRVFDPSDADYS